MNRHSARRKLGLALFCFAISAFSAVSAAEPEDVPLWKPGTGGANAEKTSLRWYVPEKPNGTIIVICPGGGYGMLVKGNEGYDVAKWLNKYGVTGVVLSYRIAPNRHPLPLQDAAHAMRTVRAEGKSRGVEPKKVGVMGFSAGGHLASTIATHFDDGDPKSEDPIEKMSSRPDFQILIYPVVTMAAKTEGGTKRNLLGNNPSQELIDLLSNEKQVTDRTPPAFVCHSAKDQLVPVDNSRMYVEALKAHKVPVEYLEFTEGGHGFTGSKLPLWQMWQTACAKWLLQREYIDLRQEVRDLQQSAAAIEKIAREQYRLTRDGEVIHIYDEEQDDGRDAASKPETDALEGGKAVDGIVTKRTDLIEAGKYCQIVVSAGEKELVIWSYLKARYQENETFRFVKTTIYDSLKHDAIFFENGKTLSIFEDHVEYDGKKYEFVATGKTENVFVDEDKLGMGRFIRTFF